MVHIFTVLRIYAQLWVRYKGPIDKSAVECITVLNSYTLYQHLGQYCTHSSKWQNYAVYFNHQVETKGKETDETNNGVDIIEGLQSSRLKFHEISVNACIY